MEIAPIAPPTMDTVMDAGITVMVINTDVSVMEMGADQEKHIVISWKIKTTVILDKEDFFTASYFFVFTPWTFFDNHAIINTNKDNEILIIPGLFYVDML